MAATEIRPGEATAEDIEQLAALTHGLPIGSPVHDLLETIVSKLAVGEGVSLVASDDELSPNEAAKMLGMSRQHLLNFLGAGALRYSMVGAHYRIKYVDLQDFAERRNRAAAAAAQVRAGKDAYLEQVLDSVAPLTEELVEDLDQI